MQWAGPDKRTTLHLRILLDNADVRGARGNFCKGANFTPPLSCPCPSFRFPSPLLHSLLPSPPTLITLPSAKRPLKYSFVRRVQTHLYFEPVRSVCNTFGSLLCELKGNLHSPRGTQQHGSQLRASTRLACQVCIVVSQSLNNHDELSTMRLTALLHTTTMSYCCRVFYYNDFQLTITIITIIIIMMSIERQCGVRWRGTRQQSRWRSVLSDACTYQ